MSEQLAFDLEALGLEVDPTPAMLRGEQLVWQCTWCGAVVVQPSGWTDVTLRACSVCGSTTGWWEQRFPIAGLRMLPRREDEQ